MGNVPVRYRERWLTAQDGLRIFYREYGPPDARDRLPVLCLTGLTRNSKDFRAIGEWLGTDRRVLCPDYRGRGRSEYDSDWGNYNPQVYVNDIRHLLAATNIHPVVVIGTSLGGLLAMGLAAAAPTLVAGALLNDVGPEVHVEGIERILDYISRDHPQPDWESAASHLRMLMPDFGLETDEEWHAFAESTFRRGADGMLHFDWDVRLARALDTDVTDAYDLWALFGALRHVPVTALRGTNSDVLSSKTFDRMAKAMPELERFEIPGRGHAPTLDEPKAREAIASLIKRAEATRVH